MTASYFWKCSQSHINDLHNLLQNLHPKINLTKEYNLKELPFLNILIKNQNELIITNLYLNPTIPPSQNQTLTP